MTASGCSSYPHDSATWAPARRRQGRRCPWRVDRVREAGCETVGEVVDFENTFLLRYVRGPEGLMVELAERLDGAPGSMARLNPAGFEGAGG
jgi:hypothetical protein